MAKTEPKHFEDFSVNAAGIALPKPAADVPVVAAPEFKPFNDLLLIRAEKFVEGTIITKGVMEFRFEIGRIIAIGPGAYQAGVRCDTGLNVGDRVLVEKSHVIEVKIDGAEYYLAKPATVMGVLGEKTHVDVRVS